ncbi:hypothetical protein MMC21_002859 [Puttea exsequens]|nr:hypothetical protein [Puttea exsequens]
MPGGFPNFRFDPSTDPQEILRSRIAASAQSVQPSKTAKLSKDQRSGERDSMPKKQSYKRPEGQFEKL